MVISLININKMLKILKNLKLKDENKLRQQYILNIMLNTIIILTFVGVIIIAYNLLFIPSKNYEHQSLPLIFVLIILIIITSLRVASYKGYIRFSSYILITILFSLATYIGYRWGVDSQAGILFYVLVIVISGILIGAKFSLISTFTVSTALFAINYLQNSQIIKADRSWVYESWSNTDVIVTSIILFIITAVLWLFNRELNRSESELKNERDLLEIRVEEKTTELKIIQAKEIAQVYHFAEFGKLSSGLFHDLVNPLTALMLNINKVKLDSENEPSFNIIKSEINAAIKASEKMKDFIISVRKQINFQDQKEDFSLNQEIEEAITILNYKSKQNKVEIIFNANKNIIIQGDAVKFNQVVTNLLSNAIDACEENDLNKEVIIDLKELENKIELKISDNGIGIEAEIISQIFEQFFTTKHNGANLGLGLSLIKKIIEESFSGTISVYSKIGVGTTFTIQIPTIHT